MREIRFRAWDGNKMTQPFGIGQNKYDVDPAMWQAVMQYTGLKDKNGVEIYEGDVVQFHSFIKAPTESDYFGTGVIEYRPDFMMFVISQKNRDWTYEETSDIDEDCIEVIGNIYENPELLEK